MAVCWAADGMGGTILKAAQKEFYISALLAVLPYSILRAAVCEDDGVGENRMKRFVCLALLLTMLAASVCALAAGSTVTALEGAAGGLYENVAFSDGFYGYCIDASKHGAAQSDVFDVADTSAATSNKDGTDISQKLKVLFYHCFEDIFAKQSDGTYQIKDSLLENQILGIIYNYSDGYYYWHALKNKAEAYTGPAIPDEGATKTLANGDTVRFTFKVFLPRNGEDTHQTFFAYKVEIVPEDVAETYIVKFNPNGGSGAMDDQEFTQDEAQKLTANAFSRTGHTFEGWNTRADGMGTAYADEQSVTVSGDMELYAQWKPETYEITYALDGGEITGSYPENYTYGEGATLPENVERDGYTFLGWYDEDGNKVERIDGDETGDKTYTARWEEKRYDVIIVPSANGDITAEPDNGAQNDRITVTVTPDDGYELDELYVGGEKVDVNEDGTYTFQMPDEDVEIRATFKKIIYTVTVTDDGHGHGTATPSSGESGTEVTLTATPNEGYQFKEWQVISGGVTIEGNKLTIEDEDVVVKAIFEEIPKPVYTVTVTDDGHGTGTAIPGSGESGTEVTLTATPNEGYQFKEWQVISGDVTIEGNKLTIEDEDVVVKAIFEEIPKPVYTVTVTDDGHGHGTATPNGGESGTEVTLTATPNEGYQFKEWQVISGGVTNEGNKLTIEDEDVVVKAIFEEIPKPVYTVTVTDDGHGTGTAIPGSGESGTEVTLTATPNEGYQFKEWQVISGDVTIDGNKLTIEDEDVVVKAVFEEIPKPVYTVTVTDDGHGHGIATPSSGESGTEVTLTATPNEGYQFKEWQVISGNVTIEGNKLTIEDEDVVVKAIFEEIPPTVYTVHFDANGGSGTMEDQPFEAGVEQTLNHNTFFREGYTFAGWNTEADGSGTAVEDGASIQITGNGTLYAQWTVNPPVNPLRIVQQPVNQTVFPGQTATFSVVAQGDGLTYQWYVDYNDGHGLQELEGADDPVYVTSVVQPGNDGYVYVCIVTDVYGNTVSSEAAVLHVAAMPALPTTGDSSSAALYLAMGMLSILGLALLRRKADHR